MVRLAVSVFDGVRSGALYPDRRFMGRPSTMTGFMPLVGKAPGYRRVPTVRYDHGVEGAVDEISEWEERATRGMSDL
jgi:hypothetical protein